MNVQSNLATEAQYLEMVRSTAGMALTEIEKKIPTVPWGDASLWGVASRQLVGMLLEGYPRNIDARTPKFHLFTSMISEPMWRKLARATGFVEHWANGTAKETELMYLHLEVRCIMALDTVAMVIETGLSEIFPDEDNAKMLCNAIIAEFQPA